MNEKTIILISRKNFLHIHCYITRTAKHDSTKYLRYKKSVYHSALLKGLFS